MECSAAQIMRLAQYPSLLIDPKIKKKKRNALLRNSKVIIHRAEELGVHVL
jgi:hypothetical protein